MWQAEEAHSLIHPYLGREKEEGCSAPGRKENSRLGGNFQEGKVEKENSLTEKY